MAETPRHIPEGFPGQRIVVLPRPIVREALERRLPVALIPSDVGYFPEAAHHYFQRPKGCGQLILILCVRGSGWVEVGDARHEVTPGQLVAILPREPHRYGAGEDHPWTIYWCHAAGRAAEQLGAMLREDSGSPLLDVHDPLRLAGLFDEIADELGGGYGLDHLIPASLALGHLLGLAMALRRRRQSPSDASVRVQRVLAYMRQRREEQLSIPELAGMVNLSTSHFCAVFKRVTGFPPLDYFIRLKIRRGCELLDGTRLPVQRIAEELGFADAFYFSRVFRRIHGVSPTAYRNVIKG